MSRIVFFALSFCFLISCDNILSSNGDDSDLQKSYEIAYVNEDPDNHAGTIYAIQPNANESEKVMELQKFLNYLTWSPDGSKVATNEYGWFRIGWRESSEEKQLNTLSGHMSWFPDSENVAIPSRDSIVVVNVYDESRQVVAQGSAPAVSPDGNKIAYYHNEALHLMEPSGNSLGTIDEIDDRDARHNVPWSPDGRYLAYTKKRDIWLFETETEQTSRLTESGQIMPRVFSDRFNWSPQGERMVYIESEDDGKDRMYVIDITSQEPELVLEEEELAHPVWSPDPEENAVYYRTTSPHRVMKVNVDNGEPEKVIRLDSYRSFAVSPLLEGK